MTARFAILLLAAWVAAVPDHPALAQQPATYQAVYTARASGLSGKAYRRLELGDNGRYQLSQTLEVRVLGARLGEVAESSRFTYLDGTLRPETYEYVQSGISSRRQAVHFDWQQGVASSTEDDESWQLTLSDGVVDKLSFQLLLREALLSPDIAETEIAMVDGDEIELHRYRVAGTEIIETGLGRLATIRVERVRSPQSRRQTTFWLARDWQLLLVKFEQNDGSGSGTVLSLDEARLDGQEVTPLP